MKFSPLILAAALISACITSPASAASKQFDVVGVVRAPLSSSGEITIAHEDIPGLMPAMTMKFDVTPGSGADALAVGDRVRFHLKVDENAMVAGGFSVMGREAAPAAVPPGKVSGKRLREGDALPEFSLVDQDKQAFGNEQLRGHLTVVTFIFTRCPVPEFCPAMALRFAQLQKSILADPKLAGRARLLSITLDPEFDRPEVLKAYGSAVGADPAVWQFVTGSKDAITALTKAFAVYTEKNGVTLDHTLCTALIDPTGRVAAIWRGNGWHVDEVVAAMTAANAP